MIPKPENSATTSSVTPELDLKLEELVELLDSVGALQPLFPHLKMGTRANYLTGLFVRIKTVQHFAHLTLR